MSKILSNNMKNKCLSEEKQFNTQTGHWDKDNSRIKSTGEVFTPTTLVLEMLEQLPDEQWSDGKTFLEPSCGNGQFLAAILIIKQSLGHKHLLDCVYGVDLMPDNIAECRQRLLNIAGDTPENRALVNKNIRCEDALSFDYDFEHEETVFDSLFE